MAMEGDATSSMPVKAEPWRIDMARQKLAALTDHDLLTLLRFQKRPQTLVPNPMDAPTEPLSNAASYTSQHRLVSGTSPRDSAIPMSTDSAGHFLSPSHYHPAALDQPSWFERNHHQMQKLQSSRQYRYSPGKIPLASASARPSVVGLGQEWVSPQPSSEHPGASVLPSASPHNSSSFLKVRSRRDASPFAKSPSHGPSAEMQEPQLRTLRDFLDAGSFSPLPERTGPPRCLDASDMNSPIFDRSMIKGEPLVLKERIVSTSPPEFLQLRGAIIGERDISGDECSPLSQQQSRHTEIATADNSHTEIARADNSRNNAQTFDDPLAPHSALRPPPTAASPSEVPVQQPTIMDSPQRPQQQQQQQQAIPTRATGSPDPSTKSPIVSSVLGSPTIQRAHGPQPTGIVSSRYYDLEHEVFLT